MKDTYPTSEVYNKLYAKYFERPLDSFFRGIDLNGKLVMDLCCGTGRASKYAVDHGALEIDAIDISKKMTDMIPKDSPHISVYNRTVSGILKLLDAADVQNYYDVIVCQQAINYWFKEKHIKSIFRILKEGGIFVFNTFLNKPSEKINIKRYSIDNRSYAEAFYLVDNMVHHVQMAEGIEMHLTKFRWIPPEEFNRILGKYFKTNVRVDKNTAIWNCIKE